MLRQHVVSVSDQQAGLFKASFVFEKKSATSIAKTDANATSRGESEPATKGPDPSKTRVSPNIAGLVRGAKKNFQQGNYKAAEKQYQQILAEDRNNIDALSNLGVVYVRSRNLRSAESTLEQAVAIAPDNDALLTRLDVVQSRQPKFD